MKREKFYKVYQAWADMKQKCNNPKNRMYKSFGKLGIKYHPRWEHYENFREDMLVPFLKALRIQEKELGEADTRKIMLGRLDPTKDFSKDNCVWCSHSEQSSRTSIQRTNYVLASDGMNKHIFRTFAEMAENFNVSRTGISNAFHRGVNYIKGIKFRVITEEEYNRALQDHVFLNSLEVEI